MGAFVRDPETGIATWDDAAEAAPVVQPRSGVGEVATGLKRGAMVELPRMFGGALKATGQPGDTLYNTGKSIQDSAEARGMQPGLTRNPDQHGWFTNALASGGEMVVPSMAGMVAAAPLAAVGAPAAAVVGAGALTSGGLFGASQFQETYEHVKDAGGTDADAKKAGWLAGAIEAGGETLANFVGGKFALGMGKGLKNATLDTALQSMKNPQVLKPFAAQYAKTLGVETGTEMAQNYGESAVEKAYGVESDPTAAAMEAVAPTFGMTTLLAPFGLHANMKRAAQVKKDVAALVDPSAGADARIDAANRLGTMLDSEPPPGVAEDEWKKQVMEWRLSALEAAAFGQPVDVDSLLSASLAGRRGEFAAAAADQEATQARQAAQANIQPDMVATDAALAGDQAQDELAPAQPTMTAQEAAQAARTQQVQEATAARAAQLGEDEDGLTIAPPAPAAPAATTKPAASAKPAAPGAAVEPALVAAAKQVGVAAPSAKAAARKLGDTQRTPEEQAAEAMRIAAKLEADGVSEQQVKALRAYAASLTGGTQNVQAAKVDQGAEPQSGNTQDNAAVPQAAQGQPTQGDVASQPAQATAQKDTAKPITAEEAGLVDQPKTPAGMSLLDQLSEAAKTPIQPQTEAPQKNVPKPKTAKGDADVLAKKVKQLPEEDRAVAEKAWNNLRNADAKQVGAPKESFVIPEWANLPAEAQHIFATGLASDGHKLTEGQRYAAAKAAAIRVAGEAKAAEVNAEVDADNKRESEARRREGALGQIEQLMRKIEAAPTGTQRDALVKQVQELHNIVAKREGKPVVPYADLRAVYGVDLSSPRSAHTALMTALEVMPEQGKAAFLMDMMGRMLDASEKLGFSAKLAKQLMGLYPEAIKAIKVKYSEKEGKTGKDGHKQLGSYDAKSNTITIYQGGENWHTVMHEVIHALTVHAMADARAKIKAGQKSATTVALQNLEALHESLKDNEALAGEYGMKSVEEFVAEAMSSAMFQSKLRNLPGITGMKTMGTALSNAFQQLVKALRTILRLPERSGNALAQAVNLSSALIDLQNAGTDTKATGKFDMAQSPQAAVQTVHQQVGGLIKGVQTWLAKGGFAGKGRRTAMYLASTKQIERWVKGMFSGSPTAQKMGSAIRKWFDADDAATRARKVVTDVQYGHLEDMQAALDKTGNPSKYGQQVALLASEMSRLNLDLSKDYAANKQANKKLGDSQEMKDHVNALHKMYMSMKGNQKASHLIPLIHSGVLVNRKMYVMQTATLLVSALHAAQQQGANQTDPATAALTKFADKLDILAPATGKKVTNPAMFMDAKTEELNDALDQAFSYVKQHFPGGDLNESIVMIEKFYRAAIANPYMHLGRSGRYMVRFEVKDPSQATLDKLNALLGDQNRALVPFEGNKRSVFMRFDDQLTMQKVFDIMSKHPELLADGTLAGGAITDADAMDKAFAVSTAVGKLRKLMMEKYADMQSSGKKDPAMAKAYAAAVNMVNSALIDMMESTSARKMGARREGTPGYELDYLKNFAKRAEAYTSTIANQYAAPAFAQASRDMKEVISATEHESPAMATKATEVYEELSERHANSMSPVDAPVIDAIRTFGYHFYLSLSPAFIITNLMQPYHLTLPFIGGRYGFVKTAKAMGKNSTKAVQIVSGTVKAAFDANGWRGVLDARLDLDHAGLSTGEKEFIEKLVASGVVDFTQAHEIGRMAEGEDRRAATLAKTLGIASHYSEVVNRLTAGLTAYQLAGERVKAGTMSAEEQFDYALEAVNRTQFNYSDHNTARALGRHGMAGKMTPLFMSFQQYAFQTMEHYIQFVHEGFLSRDPSLTAEDRAAARKGLLGTLAMTGGIAGMLGLPFASVLVVLANAAGGDDDDIRSKLRSWLAATFGNDLGEIIARGAPRAAGVDVSSRAGHADLIPGTRWLADRRNFEDKMKDGSQTMMGPAVNAGIDIVSGMGKVADGDIMGGVEAAMPMALKGVIKAARLAHTGAFENKSGNTLPIPVEWNDLLAQSVGLTPAKKAEQSEANFYHQSQQALSKQTKAHLKQAAVAALEHGDMEAFGEAMQGVTAYNVDHPDAPLLGTDISSTVTARARGRALAEASGTGIIDSNVRNFPRLGGYSWANTGIGKRE